MQWLGIITPLQWLFSVKLLTESTISPVVSIHRVTSADRHTYVNTCSCSHHKTGIKHCVCIWTHHRIFTWRNHATLPKVLFGLWSTVHINYEHFGNYTLKGSLLAPMILLIETLELYHYNIKETMWPKKIFKFYYDSRGCKIIAFHKFCYLFPQNSATWHVCL